MRPHLVHAALFGAFLYAVSGCGGDSESSADDEANSGGTAMASGGATEMAGSQSNSGGMAGSSSGGSSASGATTDSAGSDSGEAGTSSSAAGQSSSGGDSSFAGTASGGDTTGEAGQTAVSGQAGEVGTNAGAGNGGDSGQAGEAGATAGGSTASGACPDAPPEPGSDCTPPWTASDSVGFGGTALVHCSWGDDPRPECRTLAICEDDKWRVTEPDAQACAEPVLSPECPSSIPDNGSDCSDTAVGCRYDDGTRCSCSSCRGGPDAPSCQIIDPPQWHCVPLADGCPNPMAQAGEACDTPDLNCGDSCGSPIRCEDGVWKWLSCQSCCPICASPDTRIETPTGARPIASLKPGDLVYSVDHGAIRPVPLLRVGRTRVSHHHVMRVVLSDGGVLEISPGHPTADGRSFGELLPHSHLDETHTVVSAELVPYEHEATYDILPASSTGTYFAAGALVGSTLFHPSLR